MNRARLVAPAVRSLVLPALLALAARAAPAADVVATWNGSAGNWSDAPRWSSNPLYPDNGNGGLTFDAVINGGTCTLDLNVEIERLTLAGGTLTGGTAETPRNLTLNAGLTWTAGSMTGTGTTAVAPGGTLDLPGTAPRSLFRTLENAGTATYAGGALYFYGGTVRNEAGAAFTLAGGTFFNVSGAPAFINAGTVTKTGSGTLTIQVPFNHSGTADVEGGTLTLSGGGTGTGTFTVSPGATLRFTATYSHNPGARVQGAGTVEIAGGTHTFPDGAFLPTGTVNFSAGTATVNNALAPSSLGPIAGTVTFNGPLTMQTPTLTVGGSATFNGALTMPADTVGSITGTATFNAPVTFDALTLSGTLGGAERVTVDGALTWTTGSMTGTGTTAVGAGGTLDLPGTVTRSLFRTLENAGTATYAGGTLTLSGGGTGTGTFSVSPGATLQFPATYAHNPGSALTGGGTVRVSGGTHAFPDGAFDLAGVLALDVGTVTFGGTQRIAALNVNNGTPRMTGGGTAALVVQALAIDTTDSALDLGVGNLVWDYADAGPSPLATVRGWVRSGYNKAGGGKWNGWGIRSSAAAGDDRTALGVLDNADAWIGGKTHLEGQPVDASSVLVKYTWWGDANLDGRVTFDDYDVIDYYYWFPELAPEKGWWTGDFDYDGDVDFDDYDKIDYAYWFQAGPLGGAAGGAWTAGAEHPPSGVPEPATVALLAAGAAILTRRRRLP